MKRDYITNKKSLYTTEEEFCSSKCSSFDVDWNIKIKKLRKCFCFLNGKFKISVLSSRTVLLLHNFVKWITHWGSVIESFKFLLILLLELLYWKNIEFSVNQLLMIDNWWKRPSQHKIHPHISFTALRI